MSDKKIKKILSIFFLINIALLGAYGYLFFAVKNKNTATMELYAASHQQTSDKEKTKELARMLKETEKDRNKLSEYFITKTNAVTFIEQVEKIGKDIGVNLSTNAIADGAKDSGAIEFSFSATGSFRNIYQLIALIESMPYKATIKKADIQKMSDQNESSGKWKGNFIMMLWGFVAVPPAPVANEGVKK